ncbi:hypothetical protein DL764_003587 [Monosporascus ibericus]|uniref:Heterokaryon incompatibility domain-containing protein n=1 Tax=Monosporascus ibericus TaxID=155417 RepID=A0A4Q4TJK2_9PEZI|nr:hypothetical protein DL764_003587 [Monosporascus ibericus]
MTEWSGESRVTGGSGLYRPMLGDEIRLLRIQPGSHPAISCELVHVPLSQKPLFWALSYAWGSRENPKGIFVNGGQFSITDNLHAALIEFRTLLKKSNGKGAAPLLWVDSICINQASRKEKEEEIPRMGIVYRRCERVLAWLGPMGPDDDDTAVCELTALLNHLESLAGEYGKTLHQHVQAYTTSRVDSSPAELQSLMQTISLIGGRAWFKRVWVVQEVTLASGDPIMLLGPYAFSFDTYYSLLSSLGSCGLPAPKPVSYQPISCHAMARAAFRQPQYITPETQGDLNVLHRIALDMLTFVFYTSGLQATVPHDHIYGLIGLMRYSPLPDDLRPQYLEPFELVYHRLAVYLLSETNDYDVLSLGRLGALDGVPSWVPDLRHGDQNVREHYPQPRRPIISIEEGAILAVPAVILGECVSVTPALTLQDVSADPLRSFVQRDAAIFAEAARIRGVPIEPVFEGWLRAHVFRARPGLSLPDCQDPEAMIRSLMRVYKHIRRGDAFETGTLSLEEQSSLASVQQLLSQPEFRASILCSKLFVLQNGSIGSPHPSPTDVRCGDTLCVFPGRSYPLIVRSLHVGQDQDYLWLARGQVMEREGIPHHMLLEWTLRRSEQKEQHRIVGQTDLDGYDGLDEYHESISLSQLHLASKHDVTELYVV